MVLMNGVEMFGLTEAKKRVNRVKRNSLAEADLRSASVGPICYSYELRPVWFGLRLASAGPIRIGLF